MRASLRGQLIRGLLLVVTPLWLITSVLMALDARHEVYELYDNQQRSFAQQLYSTLPVLLRQRGEPVQREDHVDHQAIALWGPQGQPLLTDPEGVELSYHGGKSGFHTVMHDGREWRVYYLSGVEGTVAVAQELSERREIIRGLLGTQSLLWLLLLPFALGAVWWALGRGLRPLEALRSALRQRQPDDATPLSREVPRELQPLIDSMNGLIDRSAGTLQRERQFTASAAHELRSPLAALRVQAELLTLLDEPAARNAAAGKVMQGVDRASHLVDELLSLSRLEQQQGLPSQPLDWAQIVEQACQQVAELAAQRGSHIERQISGAPLAAGEATLLTLLLRNLLDNALRYSPAGSRIVLEAGPRQIRVLDNGPGIAAEYLAQVGQRFFRPPGQSQSGSGLGLSIVRRIAELHGLTLAWHNREQGGLAVELTAGH
ncbi:ATP-binding protein [Vogesella sp. LIG4]|uniref:ATP-binding protein n=1 Tax=Vogesella sp. LIG4 TaxID=1192162 RepID=UPI00081FC32D|nr:ATP-binding protein [Vogesella sp. LIG4]SCK15803.1 two-component system, OmpR family, sensor histidine kinase QseC [Vogesella sp. LIG4]